MLPARFLEPWEVLDGIAEIPQQIGSGQRVLVELVVDKASKFFFACPLPSKEARGLARILVDLCIKFGVPSFIRADE